MFVTDVHESEDALAWVARHAAGYDAVLVGGDLSRGGPQAFVWRFLAASLSACKEVLYVPGNSDFRDGAVPPGTKAIHGRKVVLAGLRIGGLGGSNKTPFQTPFEMTDDEAREVLSALGPTDVLMSHCPPAGTSCDRTLRGHVGSAPVREYVEKEVPVLVLSGHVHESRGVGSVGRTMVANPGPLREGHFAEVQLTPDVSVELKDADLGS
jgi:uncharacterized protein